MPVFENPENAILHTEWRHPLPIPQRMPSAGSNVYTASGQPLTLLERIGDAVSGEADVYSDARGGCIKIFYPDKLTYAKLRKIRVMSRSREAVRAVDPEVFRRTAWPDTLIFADQNGQMPVGYRMRYFKNAKKLTISRRRRPAPLLAANLACSAAELACFAAQCNFRLCDALSPRNMLYDETGAVFVVDMDSAEFAADSSLYETVVGIEHEYAPERLSGAAAYHTPQEDAWQLQTLLFQILLTSQPYLRKGAGDIKDIVNGNYAFPRGIYQRSAFELPHESYIDDMMQLPVRLREVFYHSFSGSGECFHPAKRLPVEFWLREMQQYRNKLLEIK